MEYLNIAVVSSDDAYNRTLCMSLLHSCRQLKVTAFTSRQFVLAWSEHQGSSAFYDCYDLILWAGDEICDSYGDNIIFLTDRSSLVNIDYDARRFALYKYEPTTELVALIFDIYSHLTGRSVSLVKRDNVRVVAFASCAGGVGCTTLARAVCQDFARFRGRRVLYLSLEEVESAGDFLSFPQEIKTEGEYLYRLLGKKEAPFLESYLIKDSFGISSFAPAAGKNPFRELTRADMQTVLAALMDSGMFDEIIADVSTCLDEAAIALLEPAAHICLIAKTAQPGCREKNYMKQLKSFCGEEVCERLIRVDRRFDSSQELNPIASIEGEFGRFVSKLTERLLDVVK